MASMERAAADTLAEQRVLLLHHRYRTAGGEERFVDGLQALLAGAGAHVVRLERESGPGAGAALWAGRGLIAGGLRPRDVADVVRRERIGVVHAHNLQPTFGWRALAAGRAAGARTVLHLHNHRLYCAIGVASRDGAPCHDCAPRRTHHGVVHRCRGSLAEALPYAAGLAAWQPRLLAAADRVAVPAAGLAATMAAHGVELGDPHVVPGWVEDAAFAAASTAARGEHVLFAGRVAEEKGVLVAIAAAARSGVPLVVAGEGPDLGRARALAAESAAPVTFRGLLAPDALVAARARALAAVVPSICEDVLPLAAIEALAAGLPVVGSDRGGVPTLTTPDLIVPAGDAAALAVVFARLAADADLRAAAGAAALVRARESFTKARAGERLAALYTWDAARAGT